MGVMRGLHPFKPIVAMCMFMRLAVASVLPIMVSSVAMADAFASRSFSVSVVVQKTCSITTSGSISFVQAQGEASGVSAQMGDGATATIICNGLTGYSVGATSLNGFRMKNRDRDRFADIPYRLHGRPAGSSVLTAMSGTNLSLSHIAGGGALANVFSGSIAGGKAAIHASDLSFGYEDTVTLTLLF